MSPLRESSSWTSRYKEDTMIEPLRRYYLIFEGAHTELKYFEGIDNNSRSLGISSAIELVILHKEDEIENYSHPKKLLELINNKKDQLKIDGEFDEEIDIFVMIFDRDGFKSPEEFKEFIELAGKNNILAVTNPCFELWLILHYDNSVENYIFNNETEILTNKKVSHHHTFISKLFSEISGMNPKSNLNFDQLKDKVDIAIMQEKRLYQTNEDIAESIGSNVGLLIEEMKRDPRKGII